ncbi:hypothetical protein ACIBI8_07310 [Streptomyces sp. NPDC050529]|uniref:hypothetical protein n=1 Tax=Streptomyces sp. NPDC050529 TaxID=3365624 RepID=UPI003797E304
MTAMAPPGLGQDHGRRFSLTGTIPTLAVLFTVLAELAAGAPSQMPSRKQLVSSLESLVPGEWVLLFLGVTIAALLLQPLQQQLVRCLEGYPLTRGVGLLLGRPLVARWRRRWERLNALQQRVNPRPEDLPVMIEAAARLARLPRAPERLMPTRLGNTLRAAEDRPAETYGLDTVAAWPELYAVLPERTAALVDDARDQLDMTCRMTAAFAVMGALSAAILPFGWWTFLAVAFFLLSALTYRSAISAGENYGRLVNAAVNLHRFDLLAAFHLSLPATPAEERARFSALSIRLRQGLPATEPYEHTAA